MTMAKNQTRLRRSSTQTEEPLPVCGRESESPTGAYKLEFKLQGLPKIITNGSHGSWRAAHSAKKRWKIAVAHAVLCPRSKAPKVPLTSARVECVRHSSVRPDRDNLAASFKPILDGLVNVGVLADDSDDVIKEMVYRWEKVARGRGFVTVTVEEVDMSEQKQGEAE